MAMRWFLATMVTVLTASGAAAQPAADAPRDVHVLVGDQFVLEPGFAVGDISIADPEIADYRVRPGRKSVLLLGKGSGRTKLICWDQTGKGRSEYTVVVETREQQQAEAKLRALLRDFPSVRVERLEGDLVVSGTVSSEEDLALIERMAASTGAESFVRYAEPEARLPMPSGDAREPARPGDRGLPAPPPSGRGGAASASPTPAAGGAMIEYDVQLLEASINFGSSSYETGVEPSGRVLHTAKVRAALGQDGQTMIPGKVIASKDIKIADKDMAASGIRLTFTPESYEDGQLNTRILVETNVPVKSESYVPGGWRRARWESAAALSTPFSVAGADLLVVPELSSGTGTLTKLSGAADAVGRFPGVSYLPGGSYASSSYVPYYNKDRKTHLLVLVRARTVAAP